MEKNLELEALREIMAQLGVLNTRVDRLIDAIPIPEQRTDDCPALVVCQRLNTEFPPCKAGEYDSALRVQDCMASLILLLDRLVTAGENARDI